MAEIEDNAVLGEKAVNERVDQERWEQAQEYLNSEDTDIEEDVNIVDDDDEEQYFHLPTTDASGLKNEGGFEMRDVPIRGKEAPGETADGRIVLHSKFIPKLNKLPGMQAAGAGLDGISQLLNTAQDVANFATGQDDPETGESRWGDIIPTVPEDPSMSGGMTGISRPMIKYLTDFYLSKKMTQTLGILKNSKKSKAALDGILANFVAFDKDQKGLSELIEHYPQLSNPVTRFLQTRKEDSNVVAKLKKVTEGAVGGLVADKLFGGFLNVLRVYRDRQFVSNLQKDRATRNVQGQPLIKRTNDFPDYGQTEKLRQQKRKQQQSEMAKMLRLGQAVSTTGRVKDIPLKDPVYSINYDRIDSFGDIKTLIAQLRRMTAKEMVEDLADTSILELFPEAKAEILADPAAAIQKTLKSDPLKTNRKEKLIASILNLTSAANLFDVQHQVLAGEIPKEEIYRAFVLWKKLHTIASQISADTSRSMSDRKELVSPLQEALPDFSDAVDDHMMEEGFDVSSMDAMQFAEMIGMEENKVKRKEFLKKLEGPSGLKMFTELWMSGLLSGIPTHEVNFAMTSLNILNHFLPETLWTATFDALGGVPKADRTHFRQVGKSLYKFNETMRHAYKLAKAAWKVTKTGGESEELKEIGGPNVVKLEGFGEPQATVANLNKLMKRHQVAAGKKEEFFQFDEAGWMGMLFDGTFNLFRTVGARPVITSDTYLKAVAFRMALLDKAWESGYAQDLTGKELIEHVDEFMNNPPEDMRINAQSLARELTFTADPGPARHVPMAEVMEHAVNKIPLLRLPFPFVRTPMQINKATFSKLPGLNLLVNESRDDIFGRGPEKGRGARRSRALAKLAMGGSLGYLAYQMADAGTATGSGPVGSNAKEIRATLKAAGWQEDSIVWQADDKSLHYYSFDRADPFGMVFGLIVDFKKFRTHVDPEVADNAEVALLLSISKQLLSKTWATNARKIFDVILAPDRTDARSLKQLAGTLVPRLVAQMGKNIDPHIKETRTMFDHIMANTPGASKFLENRHDWLGTPIVDEGHLWSTLTPTRYSTTSGRKDNDLRLEAAAVGARFNVPDGHAIDEQGVAVNITAPQEIWLVKHIARGLKAPFTETDKRGNSKKVMKTFVEFMRDKIQTKEYQLKKDPFQRDNKGDAMIVSTSNADRADVWKSVYNDYKKAAIVDFKAKYPAVADRFRRMLEIKTSELTGHDMKIRNNRMTPR
jgi:hypothetical protein